uniref:ATP synthase complex subunit 8 n=1 Tax=Pervagor janthinosoma TaxID=392925 RepID=B7ZHT0_PERJA|nr:ATP synthase F0 subunit 8 [Pervagor janthinosoma]BAH10451.1 ATPase subunit 8 [Pervagor janthinosoma]
MPQLDPAPWFLIFIFSWSVLLIVVPPKVMAHTSPNAPDTQSTEKAPAEPWPWTWH